jgi:mRNA-degrading endonuclease RelE of RelBE toxin-antitoxin system
MDYIAKLFKKISKKERESLRLLSQSLQDKKEWKALNVKRLQNSDFYRARKGRFRIIFHIESGDVVIDSIKLRNENTYRDV